MRVDGVVLRASTRTNGENPRPFELSQVPGGGGLGDPQPANDLLGVELPLQQEIDDAETRRIR